MKDLDDIMSNIHHMGSFTGGIGFHTLDTINGTPTGLYLWC